MAINIDEPRIGDTLVVVEEHILRHTFISSAGAAQYSLMMRNGQNDELCDATDDK